MPRLVAFTLQTKGTVCHLCGLTGATSADHDPPRSVLIASGCLDPDAPEFLFPAHLSCNKRRRARPITTALRDELRRRYLADLDRLTPAADLSPRWSRLRETRPDLT